MNESNDSPRIAIIGAGPAGLARDVEGNESRRAFAQRTEALCLRLAFVIPPVREDDAGGLELPLVIPGGTALRSWSIELRGDGRV